MQDDSCERRFQRTTGRTGVAIGLRSMHVAMLLFTVAWIDLAMPSEAAAQMNADSAAADTLFEEGRVALAAGDVALACQKFDTSRRLEPAIGTLLNLADCSAKLGRRRAAWVALREALRFMPENDERRAYAKEQLAALDAKLAHLVLRWEKASESGGRVTVNDERIVAPYDVPRVVEAGPIVVRVEREGVVREYVGFVDEGATLSIAIPAEPAVTAAVGPAKESVPRAAPQSGTAWPAGRVAGLTLGGVAAACLAAGTVVGIGALASNEEARDHCGGGLECPDAASRDVARQDAERASRGATISTVLLASGAVVAATSLFLLFSSAGSKRPPLRSTRTPLSLEF